MNILQTSIISSLLLLFSQCHTFSSDKQSEDRHEGYTIISEEFSMVERGGKRGFINKDGKVVVPIIYDYVEDFSEGYAAVGINGKYGFINRSGKLVIPLEYDNIRGFEGKLAPVAKQGKWGYIDKSGEEVIPLLYDDFYWFGDRSITKVVLQGKYGLIDYYGKIVLPIEYDHIFENKMYYEIEKDNLKGVVLFSGEILIPPQYTSLYFTHGDFIAYYYDKQRLLSFAGQPLTPWYDDIEPFCEGLAKVKYKGKYGYVNPHGKVVFPIAYQEANNFNEEGNTLVKYKGKWGMIDTQGKTVLPFIYDEGYLYEKISTADMSHYYCVVVKAGQSYDVSKDGQILGKIP